MGFKYCYPYFYNLTVRNSRVAGATRATGYSISMSIKTDNPSCYVNAYNCYLLGIYLGLNVLLSYLFKYSYNM